MYGQSLRNFHRILQLQGHYSPLPFCSLCQSLKKIIVMAATAAQIPPDVWQKIRELEEELNEG